LHLRNHASREAGQSPVVKILVQDFYLFNTEFNLRLTEPRSVISWLAGGVRPKVSQSRTPMRDQHRMPIDTRGRH
jgi:hypothetical protein